MDGATATAPTEELSKKASETGFQEVPPSVVLPKPAASGAEIILKGTGSTAGYGERAPSAERADIAPAKCRENGKILRESRPAQK